MLFVVYHLFGKENKNRRNGEKGEGRTCLGLTPVVFDVFLTAATKDKEKKKKIKKRKKEEKKKRGKKKKKLGEQTIKKVKRELKKKV